MTPLSGPPVTGEGAWLSGGGAMGVLLRAHNWADTALGPLAEWPQSLRTAASICLASRFPMILWLGPEFCILYNDAYAPTLGVKHPQALGQPGYVAWAEIWDVIGAMLRQVVDEGIATWSEDQRLFLRRSGYIEETYHTFSYSPIHGEDGRVLGVFTAVTETTERVLSERRVHTLREVGARTAKTRSVDEACEAIVGAMQGRPEDLPFACIYVRDSSEPNVLRLQASLRLQAGSVAAPTTLPVEGGAWPVGAVLAHRTPVTVTDLTHLGPLPGGAWETSPTEALLLPFESGDAQGLSGVLIVGVNPHRRLDDVYRGFLDLLAGQVATSLQRARAYHDNRVRAEKLAELDRAKTLFFSNVSHEFRTPLALMLGPIEDLLAGGAEPLQVKQQQQIEVLHRNALRLLKLVNTLLDFSRIEAGRVEAVFKPTDLAALTTDLASAFRSAIERAGMRLEVTCPPLDEDLFVDRDMWEKIVLNLLSNAFKYTLQGSIHVTLLLQGCSVQLQVRDTGEGIPEHEIPHLFERFHRVQGTRGRTHEGTGIGLALVQELVKLHGGSVAVESTMQQGSTFTVTLPRGTAHLPADRIASQRHLAPTAVGAEVYVEEALRWLPSSDEEQEVLNPTLPGDLPAGEGLLAAESAGDERTCIVLADDNADMRDYVRRLLMPQYRVIAVPDGEAALAAVRHSRPDLVLSDVMMPVLDGFGLLREMRADSSISTTPVILLSARAGEESRIEGLNAGADDYLVKPFSARELLARVGAHLELARLRREAAAERERLLARVTAALHHRDEFLGIASHELRTPITSLCLQLDLTKRAVRRNGSLRAVPDERLLKMMDTFEHQVGNLSGLVDDLLDVSRIANGCLTVQPSEVNLGELVERVLRQNLEQLENAACTVDIDAAPSVLGFWDPKRLEQVVINLLSNAAKYAAGTPVHVQVSQVDAWARLVVRDHGMGISPNDQDKIFNRFERAIGRSNISGLGLGLYIVKEIVRVHQGVIRVESSLGAGAEFTVDLPVAQPRYH